VRLLPTGGSPIVYGDWLGAKDAPTVLVYGHYDVQPADRPERWTTPPFEPTVRDGRLYARGASDNKGQIFAALAALQTLLADEGRLPCNVRVLLDGEEETRADNLEAFLRAGSSDHLLAADLALITDSSMLSEDQPGVVLGLRGMVALEVTVRTAAGDLHSGVWGGAVPNAIVGLTHLLSGLVHPVSGKVLVDGFYDRVAAVPPEEAESWSRLAVDEVAVAQELGVPSLAGEDGLSLWERLWARPTLDICGIWGGVQGEGVMTIIPSEAHAKISCRIVPDQEHDEVVSLLSRHLSERAPAGATVDVRLAVEGTGPFVLSVEHPAVQSALAAVRSGFGVEPVTYRAGYSVPIVDLLTRTRGLDCVLLGFMCSDENMHAPDEFVRLDVMGKAVTTYAAFFRNVGNTA
jgi:acetylornithine deacetylase/succinyl-diaminopimelate desuccinylase-like protein